MTYYARSGPKCTKFRRRILFIFSRFALLYGRAINLKPNKGTKLFSAKYGNISFIGLIEYRRNLNSSP